MSTTLPRRSFSRSGGELSQSRSPHAGAGFPTMSIPSRDRGTQFGAGMPTLLALAREMALRRACPSAQTRRTIPTESKPAAMTAKHDLELHFGPNMCPILRRQLIRSCSAAVLPHEEQRRGGLGRYLYGLTHAVARHPDHLLGIADHRQPATGAASHLAIRKQVLELAVAGHTQWLDPVAGARRADHE